MDVTIETAGAAEVELLQPLWAAMVEHHRSLVGEQWPVRPVDDAWARRREQYHGWLRDGSGTVYVARSPEGAIVGYAVVVVLTPGPTWDVGEKVGELESLSVLEAARGSGVGSRLVAACRDQLARQGIAYWSVGVVEANSGAVRLYEREGFRPFWRQLMAEVGPRQAAADPTG